MSQRYYALDSIENLLEEFDRLQCFARGLDPLLHIRDQRLLPKLHIDSPRFPIGVDRVLILPVSPVMRNWAWTNWWTRWRTGFPTVPMPTIKRSKPMSAT